MTCPKCKGGLYRRFSLLEKLALFLPLPVARTCLLECRNCGAQFRASTGLTGYLLSGAFYLTVVGLGKYWWVGLYFMGAWLLISSAKSQRSPGGRLGMGHIITAGMILGLLACIALVNQGVVGDGPNDSDPYGAYLPLFIYCGVGFAGLLILVDRVFPPKILREERTVGEEESGGTQSDTLDRNNGM